MAQIFHRSTNTFARLTIYGGLFLVAALAWTGLAVARSSYVTGAGVIRPQPVPFSHKHHVSGLGLDCRFCHTFVEESAFAGLPPTRTCMGCHSQIWDESSMLEPVRESFETDRSLVWTRVHDLPDYVYFDHSVHVGHGVGCVSCHGRVDQMPLMWQAESLQMNWCVDCHREPERFVRPIAEVFNPTYEPDDQLEEGGRLVAEYHIRRLTNCSACHR